MNETERQIEMIAWYSTLEVLFKMNEYTKSRETSFLMSKAESPDQCFKNTRYLRCECVRDFNYLLQNGLHVLDEPRLYNLYYSIAKLRKPLPFWVLGKERKELINSWVKTIDKKIASYDFFIDVDCGNLTFDGGKLTVEMIIEFLDKFNIQYELRSSGQGFHIIANGDQFKEMRFSYNENYDEDPDNVCDNFERIAKYLHQEISELVDLQMYDLRRVTKIPYSLVHYKNEIRVCFPFISLAEFEDFKYDDGNLRNFKRFMAKKGDSAWNYLIRNRKTFIFNEDKSPNVKGLFEFIKTWEDQKTSGI